MDGFSRSGEPQLLDLVTKERNWFGSSHHGGGGRGSCEENKLELTLGPPGENWSSLKQHQHQHTCNEQAGHESLLSLGHGTIKAQKIISSSLDNYYSGSPATKPWPSSAKFLQFPTNAAATQVAGKESLHKCNNTRIAELHTSNHDAPAPTENKGFSPSVATNTAVPNTSQKRTAPAPVVGWPPIRSFRRNLASTSTKPTPPETPNETHDKLTIHAKRATEARPSSTAKGLFVKINMDGIPIGRKVDLNAYDSYEKLSSAVDKLFRVLLAAQTDSFAYGIASNLEEEKPITGLLDGSGEYTLVYEDNEGDRVLVGDVPWCMFVSTVKRLRVLKTSELRALSIGSKQQKIQLNSPR
uniref:Auxin-responsive protein n=1 Tax=Kalanchoe fedtschenkoi TaxID=63787 RepID=A0A7N0TS58_KALFE